MRTQWMTLAAAAAMFFGTATWLLPVHETRAAKVQPAGVAGKVTFLKGSGKRQAMGKGAARPLRRNDEVLEGDVLQTAKDGRLEVKLADGSVIRLASASTIRVGIAKENAEKEGQNAQSKLTAGRLWASVAKAVGGQSRFAVRTENAVAGVRGTTFRVNAETDGATVVKVYEGAVAVSNAPLIEKNSASKGPIDFQGRREVAAPFQEVSRDQWEKIVGRMMSVRVAANGDEPQVQEFTAESDSRDADEHEWVAWNQQMDESAARAQ
jgi:hypothetical protein